FLIYNSIRLLNNVDKERLEKETILSEKLQQTKDIESLRKEITAANGKTLEVNRILETTRDRLDEKQKDLNRLNQQVASLSTYRKKSADLEGKNRDLEQKILELNKNSVSLKEQIDGLQQQLSKANEEKTGLENKLNDLVNKPYSDNYRTEAQRGRQNRLTVVARRTNRLDISMDVPSNLQQAINFTITTPDGATFTSSSDISAEVKIIDADATFVAGTTGISAAGDSMRRVQLIYSPAKKLKKGIYKYQIYSGIEFLGSVQVRLK
ncbi:MAG: hypothetical protein Q8N71_01845, partial [candidate division Zixibacteria bacterium]|nr:hypothetical protein [candidate division Zixibacteria bacterium]